MPKFRESFVPPTASIVTVIETIERSSTKVALVVDEQERLLGTATDGDVRRGLLRGIQLSDPVHRIMNAQPRTATADDDPAHILDIMRRNVCRQVPILDPERRVVGLRTLDEAVLIPERPNPVLLLAGGRGQRLRPLTDTLPKPMLPIGGKPILQIILESLTLHGFRDFYLSVNYKREIVKSHFGDGSAWGCSITYLEEDEPLGTAGPLSLLPRPPQHPMIVMNGDILTKVPFGALLDFHIEHQCSGTMCVRDYVLQVPYGVIEVNDHRLAEVVEKPTQRFLVNAGIYVLDPDAVAQVPRNQFYDMPTLFEQMIGGLRGASVFPIREYWIDIGRIDDFNKANADYFRIFEDDPQELVAS